jgi:hypothetical protein
MRRADAREEEGRSETDDALVDAETVIIIFSGYFWRGTFNHGQLELATYYLGMALAFPPIDVGGGNITVLEVAYVCRLKILHG